jgi:integrase
MTRHPRNAGDDFRILRQHPDDPTSGLNCQRMTKKDRRAITPFTIQEAELLISRLHADWGEDIGTYDEFRFFTGLCPSAQFALLYPKYRK